MISWLFGLFGRHPKACLIPVGLFGALAGAQLVVYRYADGEAFLGEPFGYLVAITLVLATLALLAVALAWWVRNRLVEHVDERITEMEDHLASLLAEVLARLVQDGIYNRRRTPLVPAWNEKTVSTYTSGFAALGNDPVPSLEDQLRSLDPPTGDVTAS